MEKKISKIDILFSQLVKKLELIDFIGVSRILCVPITSDGEKVRDFDIVYKEMVERFMGLNRDQKRNVFKLVKKSV